MERKLLFITGPKKTATSKLALMLNCHQDIFISYEWNIANNAISKHAKKFLAQYPEARFLFREDESLVVLYSELEKFFQKRGFKFSIIGDKLPGIKKRLLNKFSPYKVIFTIRDLESWLCKDDVQKTYLTNYDVVPTAIDYCSLFLNSFRAKDILRLRMADIIQDDRGTLDKVGAFFDMELANMGFNWRNQLNQLEHHSLYAFDKWWEGPSHGTSALKSSNFDTFTEISPHPFWDTILPIYNKYYTQIDGNFSKTEIDDDSAKLKTLMQFSALPIDKAYTSVENKKLIKDKHIGPLKRFKKTIKKKLKSLQG
jgi:hypothetical protein